MKQVNMKLREELLLIVLFTNSVFSKCSKVILLDESRETCSGWCRTIRYYHMAYYCKEISLDDILLELKLTEKDQNDDYEKHQISLYIADTPINILGMKSYEGPPLYHLSLYNTSTKKLLAGYFNNLTGLTVLDITNNQLDGIIEGSLSTLFSLKTLNLSYNAISSISPHSLIGLSELNSLNISYNKIMHIDNNVFSTVLKLKYLDLSHNVLTILGEFLNNNSLLHLDLSYNQLQEFPSRNTSVNPTYYQSLESLNLGHNFISNISSENLRNISSLTVLNLSNNNLTFLSRILFLNSFNLKRLDISSNRIPSIYFDLFNVPQQLEVLDLSNNNMSFNLYTILALKQLKVLKLNGNNIKNFDVDLLTVILVHLEEISFNFNGMISCKKLVSVVTKLSMKNIRVIHGNTTESDNILGISCSDDPDGQKEFVSSHRDNETKTNSTSILERFFNTDFKNSTFYKFFVSFDLPPSQDYVRYLNKNFSSANFYKFMEGFRNNQNIYSGLVNLTNNLLQNVERLNRVNRNISQSDLDMVSGGIKSLHSMLEDVSKNRNEIAILNQNLLKLLISQNITTDYLSKFLERYDRNDALLPLKDNGLINENFDYESALRTYFITANVLLSFIFISVLVFVLIVLSRKNVIALPNRENLQLV